MSEKPSRFKQEWEAKRQKKKSLKDAKKLALQMARGMASNKSNFDALPKELQSQVQAMFKNMDAQSSSEIS